MEEQVRELLNEYLKRVDECCENLLIEINKDDDEPVLTKNDLLLKFRHRHLTEEWLEYNGVKYSFHGSGMRAVFKNSVLDWDFDGGKRWAVIDPWKVALSMKIMDGNSIRKECQKAVIDGKMYSKDGWVFVFNEDR